MIDALNGHPNTAREHLKQCCGSLRWVDAMMSRRPFRNDKHVYDCAAESWRQLGRDDWLEAFSQHSRIGDLRGVHGAGRAWAAREQAGATGAEESIRAALAEGNQEYEKRFGHVFLVCATGKSGEEMLGLLRRRLGNDPETELAIAAAEQEKITRIRLEKLLSP